jgi:hypothetical protein
LTLGEEADVAPVGLRWQGEEEGIVTVEFETAASADAFVARFNGTFLVV